ncbi:MAG: dephospho-CoA kinase [Gammaproteobacteria bacterium]
MPGTDKPFRIGLTGGIASGKSTVADMFTELGVAVIDTDIIAREVVEPGSPGLAAVSAAFGESILNQDGSLNRSALRSAAFADEASRQQLEHILHPLIREETLRQSVDLGDAVYQLLVVPLLLESGFVDLMDRVLVVDCSTETQTKRLMARDQESAAVAERMIAAQISREERLAAADDVISNEGSPDDLTQAVADLHRKYLELAAANA